MRPEHVPWSPFTDFGARLSLAVRARWSRRRFLVAAATIVLVVGVVRVVLASRQVIAELGDTRTVLVAATDLPAGHLLSPTDFSAEHWPVGLIPEGATSTADDAVGQVVRSPVASGEPITYFRLGVGRHGLLPDERSVTLPLPLAPPPVEVGDAVELFAVAVTGFEEGPQQFVRPTSIRLTDARVATVDDRGVTVIVPESAVRAALESLAGGTVELVGRP
ncbi:MAG: SAF domain-containing protein [Actinomycetota bacterium]|nr:SAF domain-containing protein [Actinomycetota bacterium]